VTAVAGPGEQRTNRAVAWADPGPTFWTWAERLATLLAAGAGLWGVILGARSLSLSKRKELEHRSGEAAVVLTIADLIRRRVENWKVQFTYYAGTWPTDPGLVDWLGQIDEDVSFSRTMQDRATTIDLKTVSYAELVWLRFTEIRFLIGSGGATWDQIPGPMARAWRDARILLLEKCEAIIGTLDALEGLFDESVKTINGETRSQHIARVQAEIEKDAKARAVQFAAKIDEERKAQEESN
jgi:hypothetical protein